MLKSMNSLSNSLKSVLVDFKTSFREYLTLKNGAKLAGIALASYFGYFSLRICWLKRKYAHIPGPEADG